MKKGIIVVIGLLVISAASCVAQPVPHWNQINALSDQVNKKWFSVNNKEQQKQVPDAAVMANLSSAGKMMKSKIDTFAKQSNVGIKQYKTQNQKAKYLADQLLDTNVVSSYRRYVEEQQEQIAKLDKEVSEFQSQYGAFKETGIANYAQYKVLKDQRDAYKTKALAERQALLIYVDNSIEEVGSLSKYIKANKRAIGIDMFKLVSIVLK